MLAAEALLVYGITIAIFVVLELVLVRPGARVPGIGRRHFVNFSLVLMGAGLVAMLPLGTIAASLFAREHAIGLFNNLPAHPLAIVLAAIIARTLLAYWLHRAMHAVPLLWRIHRVHHSDYTLDLSTGFRHHPTEFLLAAPLYFALVVALGLPVWAALLTDLAMLAGALLKHLDAQLPGPLERLLGSLFATPDLHRYHHSSLPAETDSNFGNLLIVWDRLFGTLTRPRADGPERLGLGKAHDAVANDLAWQLRLPLGDPPQVLPEVGKKSQLEV